LFPWQRSSLHRLIDDIYADLASGFANEEKDGKE
jgi:hypothetical protein